ncbi:MAG: outer membrane lipoprotein-sorting protein [Deltaproteobacteria bacterium]|nr:MAG: outer membrane lipoprotein-sorting protein [Deltaproteobacteria bacterium]
MTRALAAVAVVAAAAPAVAGQPKGGARESAQAIVAAMIDRDPLGYGGAEAKVTMVLVDARGHRRERTLVMRSRTDGDTRYAFVRFVAPHDVAGTAFLGVDAGGERTQHLFLPALHRTRRISSSQRNASFVGTDYSYADMDLRDVEDAAARRRADERVGGRDCYVIEARPASSDSEYARIDLWIDKESLLPLRMQFFGDGGREIKRFAARKLDRVDGRWVILESKMVDLRRQHATVLRVDHIDLRDDIPLERFTVRALERE